MLHRLTATYLSSRSGQAAVLAAQAKGLGWFSEGCAAQGVSPGDVRTGNREILRKLSLSPSSSFSRGPSSLVPPAGHDGLVRPVLRSAAAPA